MREFWELYGHVALSALAEYIVSNAGVFFVSARAFFGESLCDFLRDKAAAIMG